MNDGVNETISNVTRRDKAASVPEIGRAVVKTNGLSSNIDCTKNVKDKRGDKGRVFEVVKVCVNPVEQRTIGWLWLAQAKEVHF